MSMSYLLALLSIKILRREAINQKIFLTVEANNTQTCNQYRLRNFSMVFIASILQVLCPSDKSSSCINYQAASCGFLRLPLFCFSFSAAQHGTYMQPSLNDISRSICTVELAS